MDFLNERAEKRSGVHPYRATLVVVLIVVVVAPVCYSLVPCANFAGVLLA